MIIFQVKWGVDMQDGEINFFSVSADGKVYNWILMQNELAVTTVIALNLPLEPIAGPDGTVVSVKGTNNNIKKNIKSSIKTPCVVLKTIQ